MRHAPNGKDGVLLGAVARPEVNFVALLPAGHDGATDLVLVLAKLVANHEQHLQRMWCNHVGDKATREKGWGWGGR